jgi:hydroxymethylglutaryl-CoA reductase
MVIEEPSVVAGASFAAKLVRAGGGFHTSSTPPEMIGQMQVLDITNLHAARFELLAQKDRLLDLADQTDPVIVNLKGGARDLEVRLIEESPVGPMLVVHLIFDTRDAMGANTVNTAAEALAPVVEEITGGRVLLRILSNLADRRLARARCVVPAKALTFESDGRTFEGQEVVARIVEAYALATADPYRAATHNKGIMNGVDAVVLATGNDWRAIEAGAHAYAARSGRYTSLSQWERTPEGDLVGTLEMPMALGVVGGATRVHPLPKVALKVLGAKTAQELAEIVVAVGLAQNLAALRALATEGIQRGHMSLHARQVAIAAGATGDEIERVAAQLVREKAIRLERAQELIAADQ